MKSSLPDDVMEELMAAALHGELSPEERAQWEARLQNDPAARAAYQEFEHMHDLLEKTYGEAQPDAGFEQRMVSGVRRKIAVEERPRETAWESVLVLWEVVRTFPRRVKLVEVAVVLGIIALLAGVALGPITGALKTAKGSQQMQLEAQARAERENGIANPGASPEPYVFSGVKMPAPVSVYSGAKTDNDQRDLKKVIEDQNIDYRETAKNGIPLKGYVDLKATEQFAGKGEITLGDGKAKNAGGVAFGGANTYTGVTTRNSGGLVLSGGTTTVASGGTTLTAPSEINPDALKDRNGYAPAITTQNGETRSVDKVVEDPNTIVKSGENGAVEAVRVFPSSSEATAWDSSWRAANDVRKKIEEAKAKSDSSAKPADKNGQLIASNNVPGAAGAAPASKAPAASTTTTAPAEDTRKLIRNAELELEVKSFQTAMDEIGALTKAAGGYVDTSNSQRGGNGKLQGTVVVKVLPQNLDDFLIKLRDFGVLKNQTLRTDDVTKAYVDTQARLVNSQRMEAQLQELLKRDTDKVSELLQVERELARVRGDIEQMQGELKLYDFQVAYATVTMQVRETDLNQAAAYLLKEQDDFSLFSTDVEGTFQQARHTADDFKAQILTATLTHNSGSDVSADLTVMVAPDQIETFLAQVKGLGRVSNFTRQTQRVAKDGGDSSEPADQTLTEKDKVQVHVAIQSDDESRKQMALTVVTPAVDEALDQAKAAVLATTGAEILSSSLNKTPQGQSTAALSVRVPGKSYHALLDAFRALGRTASFSLQRDDDSGPGASGDDVPVIVSLSLTDEDTPVQATEMAVVTSDVDAKAQQLKKDAAGAGAEVKASSFAHQPDGTEVAQMTFRLPMAKYAAFVETLKKLGKVESLSVQRDDRPDQARTDESAPAEISLRLHSEGDIVPDDNGLWATLRGTFGEGASALFSSVKMIGVAAAFILPWLFALGFVAWVGRRIYVWKKRS